MKILSFIGIHLDHTVLQISVRLPWIFKNRSLIICNIVYITYNIDVAIYQAGH
jgi:hypothetical protein